MEPLKNDQKLSDITIEDYTSPLGAYGEKRTELVEIQRLMNDNKVRHIPILENGKAVGIISERDLCILEGLNLFECKVAEDIMVENPVTMVAEAALENVIFQMSSKKLGSILVDDKDGKCIGIFTSIDAMNALIEILRGEH